MALYPRLLHQETPRIPVHVFMAVVAEVKRGKLTALQGANMLGLSAAERAEVQTLLATSVTAIELHDVLLIAEAGYAYNTEADLKARLGVA